MAQQTALGERIQTYTSELEHLFHALQSQHASAIKWLIEAQSSSSTTLDPAVVINAIRAAQDAANPAQAAHKDLEKTIGDKFQSMTAEIGKTQPSHGARWASAFITQPRAFVLGQTPRCCKRNTSSTRSTRLACRRNLACSRKRSRPTRAASTIKLVL